MNSDIKEEDYGKYTNLHAHSVYSALDGLGDLEDYAIRAKALGMKGLCISDHGVMIGNVAQYKVCKKHGIKPIFANEGYVTLQSGSIKEKVEGYRPSYHILLIAQNNTGYKNLMKMTSIAWNDYKYYKPRFDMALLSENSEGVICTSACFSEDTLIHSRRNGFPISSYYNVKNGIRTDVNRISLASAKISVHDKDIHEQSIVSYTKDAIPTRRSYTGMMKRITLINGFEIESTVDHKFYVSKSGQLDGVMSSVFKPGDFLELMPITFKDYDNGSEVLMGSPKPSGKAFLGFIDGYNEYSYHDYYENFGRFRSNEDREDNTVLRIPLKDFPSMDMNIFNEYVADGRAEFTISSDEKTIEYLLYPKVYEQVLTNGIKLVDNLVIKGNHKKHIFLNNGVGIRDIVSYAAGLMLGLEIKGSDTLKFTTKYLAYRTTLLLNRLTIDAVCEKRDDGLYYVKIDKELNKRRLHILDGHIRAGIDPINVYNLLISESSIHSDISPLKVKIKDITYYHVTDKFVYCLDLSAVNEYRQFYPSYVRASNCIGGPIAQFIISGDKEKAYSIATDFKSIFKDRFYLEMTYTGLKEQELVNSELRKMSTKLGIPLVITCDSHYVHKSSSLAHTKLVLVNIGGKLQKKKVKEDDDAKSISEEEDVDNSSMFYTPGEYYLKPHHVLFEDHFHEPQDAEAFENTNRIAESCNVELEFGKYLFPHPYSNPDKVLRERVMDWYSSYTANMSDSDKKTYLDRLEHELGVYMRMGFSEYPLVVQDIVQEANNRGIETGPGRGCFIADTNVTTSEGIKKIIDVKPGDLVMSEGRVFNEVVALLQFDIEEEMIMVKHDGCDYRIISTIDHKFLVNREGEERYIPAGQLVVGDKLVSSNESTPLYSVTHLVMLDKQPTRVYDLSVNGHPSYTVNHVVVHNSAAGSLISYALGITKIDPIPYGLIFARYLSAGRAKFPMIEFDGFPIDKWKEERGIL